MPFVFEDEIQQQPAAPAGRFVFEDELPRATPRTLRDLAAEPGRPVDGLREFTSRASNAGNAIARTFLDTLASLPKAVGEGAVALGNATDTNPGGVVPEDTISHRIGQSLSDYAARAFPGNPAYRDDFWTEKVPAGGGSLAGFAAGGGAAAAAKASPLAATLLMGAAATGVEGAEDYKATTERDGGDLEPAMRGRVFGLNALLGTSEGLPVMQILNRIDRTTGGGVRKVLAEGFKGSVEELAQEVFQSIGQNAIANQQALAGYDPERAFTEGTRDAAQVGGTLGFLFNSLAAALGLRLNRGQRPAAPAQEQAAAEPAPEARPGALAQAFATARGRGPEISAADLERARANIRQAQAARADATRSAPAPQEVPPERMDDGIGANWIMDPETGELVPPSRALAMGLIQAKAAAKASGEENAGQTVLGLKDYMRAVDDRLAEQGRRPALDTATGRPKEIPAETPAAPGIRPDRRQDQVTRKRIDQMTQDEMRAALLTDDLTGLGNRRAYEEAPRRAVQASIDMDALKWVNDNMGHDSGDAMLRELGRALQEEGVEAYHPSGDEFWAQFDDQAGADEALARVQRRLEAAAITVQHPDGSTITKSGVGFSYGTGQDLGTADTGLQRHKAERERAGLRAARGGEPAGVARTPAQGQQDREGGVAAEGGRPAKVENPPAPPADTDVSSEPGSGPANAGPAVSGAQEPDVDQLALFTRLGGNPRPGVAVDQVENWVAPIVLRWGRNAPAIEVVQREDQLPEYYQRFIAADGATGTVQGFHAPAEAKLYLVADNLASRREVLEKLAHEAVGHFGMEAVLGEDFAWLLDRVQWMLRKDHPRIRELAAAVRRTHGDVDAQTQAREIIALMAERRGWRSVFGQMADRIYAAVRRFLRKLGFPVGFSPDEIDGMLARAQTHLQRDDAPRERAGVGPALARVWHGSPHQFDQFDVSHIGRGEGAQAYGWGLYLASAKGVATSYVEDRTGQFEDELYAVNLYEPDLAPVLEARLRANGGALDAAAAAFRQDAKKALADGDFDGYHQNESYAGRIAKAVREGIDEIVPAGGHLYQVDLPDSAIEMMLDWDAEIADQAPAVRSALKGLVRDTYSADNVVDQFEADGILFTGRTLYSDLSLALGSDELASRKLADTGVPGIKYFDGFSRSRGKGSRNYVVFDDSILTILDRNGEPVALDDAVEGQRSGGGARVNYSRKPPEQDILDRVEAAAQAIPISTPEKLKSAYKRHRGKLLGALTRRQVVEVGRDALPAAEIYGDLSARLDAERNNLVNEGADLSERAATYRREHKEESDDLFALMHDATIEGVDPAEDFDPLDIQETRFQIATSREQMRGRSGEGNQRWLDRIKVLKGRIKNEPNRKRQHATLQRRFERLGPEAQQLYREFRDFYVDRSKQMEDALVERIERSEAGATQKKALADQIRAEFERLREDGPYFPLARFGDFWLSAKSENADPVFQLFDSAAERDRYAKAYRREGFTVETGKKIDNIRAVGGASAGFVSDVMKILKDIPGSQSEAVQDSIYQLYLTTLPELSLRKNFIHRKKRQGYSNDALRAFAKHSFHGSYQLARLRYADQMQAALEHAKQFLGSSQDPDMAADVLAELERRYEWQMNPQSAGWAQGLTSLGFVWYLGASPSAALVNLTQTPIVAYPVMAARYGWGPAGKALLKATRDFVAAGGKLDNKLSGDEAEAMTQWERDGVVDKTQAHDQATLASTDTAVYSPVANKTMRVISWMFHNAERMNREVTALATYRLARAKGQTHAMAVRAGSDVVWEGHFDYTNANRPRWMQTDAARVFLLFRNYSIHMTYMLARNAHQALAGLSKADRQEARTKLTGILGMTALFAGATGLPLYSMITFMLDAFLGDEDDPYDSDVEFRRFLAELFGTKGGQAVAVGPVEAATDVGVSSRVSLNGLWFRDPGKDLEASAMTAYWIEQMAGPVPQIPLNIAKGIDLIQDGKLQRGIEYMTPKFVKDAAKMVRYADEGVQTLRGDPIQDQTNAWQEFLQGIGFTPGELRLKYDQARATRNAAERIKDRRKYLMARFALAVRMQDFDAHREAIQAIQKFNRAQPTYAIDGDALRNSLRTRARFSAQQRDGVYLPPKLQHLRESTKFTD